MGLHGAGVLRALRGRSKSQASGRLMCSLRRRQLAEEETYRAGEAGAGSVGRREPPEVPEGLDNSAADLGVSIVVSSSPVHQCLRQDEVAM